MSKHIALPSPHHLAVITASICVYLILPISANEANQAEEAGEAEEEQIPLGGTEHTHDDESSLLIETRMHLRAAVGDTSLESSDLAHGGHDPAQSGFSVPALSLGADLRYGHSFLLFSEAIASWNDEDHWDAELEELYAQCLHLPGGFDLKLGRILATAGSQNHIHNHAWKFVNSDLSDIRFLGEDGLIIEGIELTWMMPTQWDDRFILSFGDAIEHQHDEERDVGPAMHNHNEEAEEALWDRNVFSARYQATFWTSESDRFIYGVSHVNGENFMAKRSQLYGMDLTYTWLENKTQSRQFTWRNEAMLRRVSTNEGRFEECAFSSSALYRFNPKWEVGLRYNYLEGVEDPELPERHRVSPSLTHYFFVNKLPAITRLQYDYDHSVGRGNDHSIWLQFGFDWGSGAHSHQH